MLELFSSHIFTISWRFPKCSQKTSPSPPSISLPIQVATSRGLPSPKPQGFRRPRGHWRRTRWDWLPTWDRTRLGRTPATATDFSDLRFGLCSVLQKRSFDKQKSTRVFVRLFSRRRGSFVFFFQDEELKALYIRSSSKTLSVCAMWNIVKRSFWLFSKLEISQTSAIEVDRDFTSHAELLSGKALGPLRYFCKSRRESRYSSTGWMSHTKQQDSQNASNEHHRTSVGD